MGHSVYFIREHSSGKGRIKVGVASDVNARLKSLQTGNPDLLTILAVVPAESKAHAHELEKTLHRQFAEYHIKGEWFSGKLKIKEALGRKSYKALAINPVVRMIKEMSELREHTARYKKCGSDRGCKGASQK